MAQWATSQDPTEAQLAAAQIGNHFGWDARAKIRGVLKFVAAPLHVELLGPPKLLKSPGGSLCGYV